MIEFNYQTPVTIKQARKLKAFIEHLILVEKRVPGPMSFVFCTDEYLLSINKQYLNHHFYTDIITFDLSSSKNEVSGELYISIDRIKENAKNFKTTITNELHRVMFHGVLHLCGYKDKSPKDIKLMRAKEDFYLNQYSKRST
jgi:rRNA maturation RNase YbeY